MRRLSKGVWEGGSERVREGLGGKKGKDGRGDEEGREG